MTRIVLVLLVLALLFITSGCSLSATGSSDQKTQTITVETCNDAESVGDNSCEAEVISIGGN